MKILDDVSRDPKRCVIVVTHDPRIVSFADRIAEIEDGRILNLTANPRESQERSPSAPNSPLHATQDD